MIMVTPMDDNSGKKFSLQDWVMKRAANQSGAVLPPLSARQGLSEEEAEVEVRLNDIAAAVEKEVKAVSGGATVSVSSSSAMDEDDEMGDDSEKANEKPIFDPPTDKEKDEIREMIREQLREQGAALNALSQSATTPAPQTTKSETAAPIPTDTKSQPVSVTAAQLTAQALGQPSSATTAHAAPSSASAQSPLQQLQIVRLLTDLGDRLRQSEKEREVLWKEVEICRKQIADMNGRETKTEKNYQSLETQLNQREVFVKELVEKQMNLEQKIKDQLDTIESARKEQSKLQEKINSVETAAGSAIVRVEDAIAENSKLNKKVEQLSQDKARLVRKLEVVEEALTQTQDILKAKALVLLTDQAVAAKTNLPQTPAWTGDDTLKLSQPKVEPQEKAEKAAGPLADIAASLKAKRSQYLSPSTMALIGLAILGIVGGVIASQYLKGNFDKKAEAPVIKDEMLEPATGTGDETSNQSSQDELMAQAAKIANQIEPGALEDGSEQAASEATDVAVADGVIPKEFDEARAAQDKAIADFKSIAPTTPLAERIKADRGLPKAVLAIQDKAFAGDAEAQHDLAALYVAGQNGVKTNYTRASRWFEESAHNGIANAQYNLGVLYHQGYGVNKDVNKAIQLYRVAAASGHPEAQYNLAIAYVEGVGVDYNPQIASVYFEQAASGGVVEAAYNLGLLQENGLLGESQPDEAIFWYALAAEKGSKDAQKALAQLKSQLSMNDEDAARVVKKIAEKKPSFLSADGKPSLPEPKKMASGNAGTDKSASAAPAAPVAKEQKAEAPKAPAKAETKVAANVDPVVVSQIQEQLIAQGLYKGTPNGANSPVLSQAIKTYQEKNGLTADGQPSNELLVKMLSDMVDKQAEEQESVQKKAPQAKMNN